jgi:hypothetical protein
MKDRRGGTDLLWMLAGAALLLGLGVASWRSHREGQVNEHLRRQAWQVELVGRMRSGLGAATEAEKSAVLATTDEESHAFAERARAQNAAVEQARQELEQLLRARGTDEQRAALARFSESFVALQRIDGEILALAVKNSNLRAYALAYGPATKALDAMGDALGRLAEGAAGSDGGRVAQLASRARIAALTIATLLPPHIAEPSDERMTELEAGMAAEEQVVRASLNGLAALPGAGASFDLTTATSAWAEFVDLERQILALSRENTNVRSLDLSLKQKRAAFAATLEALDSLHRAVAERKATGRWIVP